MDRAPDLFLSGDDVRQLTGCRQKAAQRRWLTRNGIPFFVRADGAPSVVQDSLRAIIARPSARPRASGFDLAALKDLR